MKKKTFHQKFCTFLAGAALSAFALLCMAYFYPSNNDFDPAFFKTALVGGKNVITLTGGGTSVSSTNAMNATNLLSGNIFYPFNWIDATGHHTNTWSYNNSFTGPEFTSAIVADGPFYTFGGIYDFADTASTIANASDGTIVLTVTNHTHALKIPQLGSAGAGVLTNDGSGFIYTVPASALGSGTTIEQTFVTDQHFSGKVTVNNFVLTNQIAYVPHTWTGATNTLDVSLATGAARWTNAVYIPQAVNGFKFDAHYTEQGVIRMINKSSTNITFTCSATGIHLPTADLTNPYTWTNGDILEFYAEIDDDATNCIIKTFH